MKTRHVLMRPPMEHGDPVEGFVLAWRQVQQRASPPIWEAYVVSVHPRWGNTRIEWVPAMYLEAVRSEPPEVP